MLKGVRAATGRPGRLLSTLAVSRLVRTLPLLPCAPVSPLQGLAGTSPKVVVVGAGLSGLTAARRLLEACFSVCGGTTLNIKCYLKALYGFTKELETAEGLPNGDALPELIIDNFDEEQIWQELELQNEARLDFLVSDVARVVAKKDKFTFLDAVPGNESSEEVDHDESGDELDPESEPESEPESQPESEPQSELGSDSDEAPFQSKEAKKKPRRPTGKPSVVDDKFFKLSDMEHFLEQQEQDNGQSDSDSDESVDLFNDLPSDEEDEDEEEEDVDNDEASNKMHYSDFFDAPEGEELGLSRRKSKVKGNDMSGNEEVSDDEDASDDEDGSGNGDSFGDATNRKDKKKVSWGIDGDDSDESDSSELQTPKKDEPKSSYQTRQERLQQKINELEKEAISEKPWQLKGEIMAEARPENALLEEALEFDLTTRPAPVMTEETTLRLEDVIKQRIKDRVWDDVERKKRLVEEPTEYKKRLVLDQEKSKLSLAQVYEQEYLKQVAAADPEEADRPAEVPKEHQEIKAMVDSLFRKLDALSNFHFTPKQVAPEVKIVTNIPAIHMEEVAPVATSDATLLAPEEVKAKPRGDVIGQAERTDTDKKRERRLKKKGQRVRAHEREKREAAVAKVRPGLGNKYSKEKAVRMLEKVSKDSNVNLVENSQSGRAVKSSSAFFTQLQEEVTTHVKERTQTAKRQKRSNVPSAKRLKL